MDRLQKIYENMHEMEKNTPGIYFHDGGTINLMEEPGFANMSFMKRKARMVEVALDHHGVRFFPGELLGGSFLGTRQAVIYNTYEERLKYADMNLAFPARNNYYIDGKEVYTSKARRLTEEDLKNPAHSGWSWGHSCGGFPRILAMGYQEISRQAKANIRAMEEANAVDIEKKDFWEAVSTTVEAVCRLSERHALELDSMAAEETDEVRKAELKQMAANMHKVPAYPAETFWEALQSVWFSFMVAIQFNGTDMGRLDQYLYPYYEKDLKAGILTKEKAEELIGNFFLKCFEQHIVSVRHKGFHPSIMLGGLKADGVDGTNDLTLMCMRATERFATSAPKISVRINEQTPKEVFETAHRMLLKGINQPDFYADRVVIEAYQRIGVPFEDAVEFAQSVCEEISLAGISEDCTNEGPHCDIHDKVKLAMERVVAGEEADTYERFQEMVEEEIRKCILEEIEFHHEQTDKLRTFSPQPLHSAAIVGCLESGKDITNGGAKYNNTGSVIGGLATGSDGLYAIKRLVYDEKRLTMKEFYQILQDNYEGNEVLRLEILNKFPKFGNDDDRVDTIAARLFDVYADELEKHRNNRGGIYKIGAWASEYRSSYMATPDGRRQGDTFAVNISPTPGRDAKGVTAVIQSGAKINMKICTAGAMLDVAMNLACIRGESGVEILKQLVTSYGALGGSGLQFNILDADTLKDAQENPLKYKNLMVRVWGYNDYFVALDKERQEHIISRTIHGKM